VSYGLQTGRQSATLCPRHGLHLRRSAASTGARETTVCSDRLAYVSITAFPLIYVCSSMCLLTTLVVQVWCIRSAVCPDDKYQTEWPLTYIFGTVVHLDLSRSTSVVKAMSKFRVTWWNNISTIVSAIHMVHVYTVGSHLAEKYALNVVKVVGVTVSQGFSSYCSRKVKRRIAEQSVCADQQWLTVLQLLWPPYVKIIFCPVVSIFLSSSIFFPCLISAAADWMSTIFPLMVWP